MFTFACKGPLRSAFSAAETVARTPYAFSFESRLVRRQGIRLTRPKPPLRLMGEPQGPCRGGFAHAGRRLSMRLGSHAGNAPAAICGGPVGGTWARSFGRRPQMTASESHFRRALSGKASAFTRMARVPPGEAHAPIPYRPGTELSSPQGHGRGAAMRPRPQHDLAQPDMAAGRRSPGSMARGAAKSRKRGPRGGTPPLW